MPLGEASTRAIEILLLLDCQVPGLLVVTHLHSLSSSSENAIWSRSGHRRDYNVTTTPGQSTRSLISRGNTVQLMAKFGQCR